MGAVAHWMETLPWLDRLRTFSVRSEDPIRAVTCLSVVAVVVAAGAVLCPFARSPHGRASAPQVSPIPASQLAPALHLVAGSRSPGDRCTCQRLAVHCLRFESQRFHLAVGEK